MVIGHKPRSEQGMLSTDLFVAMSILVLALIPITSSFLNEQKLCRAYYQRAVITQIIDGEMEVLAAGEWRAFKEGEQVYRVSSDALENLPDGTMVFTRQENRLRLEWQPAKSKGPGSVVREAIGK